MIDAAFGYHQMLKTWTTQLFSGNGGSALMECIIEFLAVVKKIKYYHVAKVSNVKIMQRFINIKLMMYKKTLLPLGIYDIFTL